MICNDSDWPESVRTYQRNVAIDRTRYPMFGAAGANITPLFLDNQCANDIATNFLVTGKRPHRDLTCRAEPA